MSGDKTGRYREGILLSDDEPSPSKNGACLTIGGREHDLLISIVESANYIPNRNRLGNILAARLKRFVLLKENNSGCLTKGNHYELTQEGLDVLEVMEND